MKSKIGIDSMGEDSNINLFSNLFWTLKLKNKLSYLSLNVNYPQEDTPQFLKSLRELASEVNFDQTRFNELLDNYLNTTNKDDLNRLDAFVNSHYRHIENEVVTIPNDIDKAYDSLRGLIASKHFENNIQAYDAMVLLKDDISSDLIKEIIVEWKLDKEYWLSTRFPDRSNIFWGSHRTMEDIDSISMYRFNEIFDIKGFDSTFIEVKKELEGRLWEHLPPETLDMGPFYFWLIDRVPGFIDVYYGTTTFLESIVNEQTEKGYWHNKALIKSQIVDEDTGIIKWAEYGKDISGTALCSINLLKHSKYGSLRDSAIKGVNWLLDQQNSDGSWSDEVRSRPSGKIQNKKSLFATLLALEALIRSDISNIAPNIELAFEWIMSKQNKWGWWDDKFLPLFTYSSFPLMTVLVLELENLLESYKEQQLDFSDDTEIVLQSDYEFDIAVSFAGEDREVVEEYVSILESKVDVFYDKNMRSELWGKNLVDELHEIYSSKAGYCVMFISKHYLEKIWTNHERQAAQERALKEKSEYILPIKLDDTEIPGLPSTLGHLDLRELSIEEIARITINKLKKH